MEYEGFCRSIEYIFGLGLVIKTFVSDRHSTISKHMREKLSHIRHYFDIWHLKKSMLILNCILKFLVIQGVPKIYAIEITYF